MKVKTTIVVDGDAFDVLKDFCEKTGIPVSRCIDDYVCAMAKTIKAVGADRADRLSKMDIVRLLGKGLALVP